METHSSIQVSKKNHTKNVIKAMLFIVLFVLLLQGVSFLLAEKSSYIRKNDFYAGSKETNYDVLFMGTSHMYDGIFPMELYRDYGISSYCLAQAGERMAMTYYSLLDALEYTDPKLIVIDMHGLEYGDQKNDPAVPLRMHISFDAIRLGEIRFRAIEDVVDENLREDFYFPLSLYHSRWSELTEQDFRDPKDYNKVNGANFELGVANCSDPKLIKQNEYTELKGDSVEYLEKIIDVCGERDIEVLLCFIPFYANEEKQMIANYAYKIAESYDHVTMINMLYYTSDMGFDYATDTADRYSHLNPLGARKVTKWLGEYLLENYKFKDYRGDKSAEYWIEDYREYLEYKDEYITTIQDFLLYLMLIMDEDYQCSIWIAPESKILENELVGNLLAEQEIEFHPNSDETENGIDVKISITNKRTGNLVETSTWKCEAGKAKRILVK